MKNFITKFLLTSVFCIFANTAFADESKDVEKYINNIGNQIIKIASNDTITVEQKKKELISYIESVVDTDWVSKFVLAKNYRIASDVQRERFRKLYREFMINTYAPKFKGYNGEKFEVVKVIKLDSYYVAKCLFYPKESPVTNLDFRIRKKPDSSDFIVLDIVAEGVSLIETQRSEFGSAIATKGLDQFLDDLEIRVKNLKSGKVNSKSASASNTGKSK